MDYKNYMGTEHNTIPENQGDRTRGGHVQDEDTEDINRSLSLDRANRYFHYSVNLSGEDIDRYRVNKQDNTRWYYLRIPLSEYKGKINDPDLSAINTFRVYVNNIGGDYGYPTIVQLAKIEITGNKWQESVRMIKNPADTSRMIPDTTKGKIEVSVINTDNSEEYKANRPNFVPVLYNTTNNTQQREQALQIKYTNVIKDSSLLVFKNFSFQQIDLSTYRVLRIYVRGMDMSHDSVYYFLRFGRDSANYYECSRRLKDQRWDSLTIEMNEITAVKKAYLDNHKFDTSARVDTSTLLNAGNPAEQCSLKIKGTQSYTNVLWVALGVKNLSNSPASGEFWVNDLKVVDIKKQKGWASRITFESRFADFLQLNSDLRYQDGGFLMLTERSKGSQGASSLTSNLSAILHANKFTPASWGLVTPLTVNLSNQVTRPKYAPSSDIELVAPGNEHDGFREIAPRLFNDMMRREIMYVPLTMASEYEGRLATRGFSTSYKKSSPSQNIFTNLIADRTTTSYNYSNRFEKQSITGSLDTSYSHQNSLDYDLSPKTQKIVSPFSKSKYNSLQGMRVHWLWDTWNMNIYDASYMRKIEIIPPGAHKTNTDTTITRTRSFLLSHSTNLNWNFLQWDKLTLSTDYNLSMYRDFYKWINSSEKGFFDFAASNVPYMTENPYFNHLGIFKGENSRKQDISYNLDSRLINMLPLTLSYSSSYNQEIKEQVISSKMSEYMKMSLGNTFTARTQLGLDPILESGEKISNLLRLNLVARVFSQAKKFVNSISFSGVSFSYSTLSNYDINGIRRLDFDSKMNSKFGFYTFQLGLKRGFYDIFSSNTGDTKRFGEFDYPYYSDSTYFVKALSDNNSRKASRNYDVSSSMTLFKKLNLSGSIAYDISWSELAKERHYDFHDTLFARSGDSSVFHMGDTTISFPDISYNARINQFLNFWKYVPMIGPSSKSAEISHSGNYKRSSTRPFDVFKYDGHYGINSSVRWRSKKDWEWVLTDKRDWNKTYDLLQTKFDYKCSWSDSLGFKRSLGAKRAFKILRWTLQFENQLDVFGGVGYGRSYDKGTTIDTTKLSSDQTREIRLDVEGYGEIKRLFKSIKDLKPTREKSNISISSGFAYNFSKNINGGGHITYQRKKEGEMPSNTVDIKVFVLIKL
ncbi:MAG: cell surface protein SprA, partial [Elusimicrobiota bacterium]